MAALLAKVTTGKLCVANQHSIVEKHVVELEIPRDAPRSESVIKQNRGEVLRVETDMSMRAVPPVSA